MFGDEKSSISLLKITPVLFPRTLLPKLKSQNFDLFLIQMKTDVISRCAFCFRANDGTMANNQHLYPLVNTPASEKKFWHAKNEESSVDGLQISKSHVYDINLHHISIKRCKFSRRNGNLETLEIITGLLFSWKDKMRCHCLMKQYKRFRIYRWTYSTSTSCSTEAKLFASFLRTSLQMKRERKSDIHTQWSVEQMEDSMSFIAVHDI